ncbi:MAG TPA: hypothetical protein VFI91_05950 [Longimicrobiaceae bacterium]|nr:hypothetical protein [Longimicrobiaceae bacterium]
MSGRVVVFKFGGAALASPSRVRRAARRVAAWKRRGASVIVVTSACGRTTDRLLRWTGAVSGDAEPATREIDRALATGEDLSCSLFAAALVARGVPAISMRGAEAGIVANGPFGRGVVQRVVPERLRDLLDRGVVPVVAGFQAARADGETITLGRGGSDVTAVHLGAAIGADYVHLVKDVDGIFDRDPHLCADARLLSRMGYDELEALVLAGAEIVHVDAVRLARDRGVRLRIYGFDSPLGGDRGTIVGFGGDGDDADSRELLSIGGQHG